MELAYREPDVNRAAELARDYSEGSQITERILVFITRAMEYNKGFEEEYQTQSHIHFSKITEADQFHGYRVEIQSGDYCQGSYVYLFAQFFEMGPSVSQICLA